MAIGKPLNRSYYTQEGQQTEIAVPPLNQETPIAAAPSTLELQPSNGDSAIAPVPEEVSQDFFNSTQNVHDSNADNLSTVEDSDRDDLSQTDQDDDVEEVVPQQKRNQESPSSKRIRELSEAQKKAERERDELMRIMQMQQMQSQMPKQQSPIEPEDDDINIEDDALIEGKQFRQMYKEMKQLKKQLHSYQSQSSESITEARIKSAYPDFDRVVSQENIAMLRDQYPEIANTLNASTDLYSKAVSAYTMIKQFGIHQDPVLQNDRLRVARNTVKPRPLASVSPQQSESPLTKANAFANGEFTESDRKRLWNEMNEARKRM